VSVDLTRVWERILGLNREVDALVDRVMRKVEPTQSIGREIPWYGVVETRFDNLPTTYAAAVNPGSDAVAGNNVKVSQWTNKSSRVYVRELSFEAYFVRVNTNFFAGANRYDARLPNAVTVFPINWRWNFHTSITGRVYSDVRVLARAAGRARAGNHLSFKKPLVVEPMETLAFECEYLGGAGMLLAAEDILGTSVVIAADLSGYREGV
jgi:hypothetical protein